VSAGGIDRHEAERVARSAADDERYEREREIRRLERELYQEREERRELAERLADLAAELYDFRDEVRAAALEPAKPEGRLE